MPFGLNSEQEVALVKAAREAAEKRGYCDEANKIIADLGFKTTRTITADVRLTFEVPNDNHRVIVSTDRISYHSDTGLGKLVDVKVTDNKPVYRGAKN